MKPIIIDVSLTGGRGPAKQAYELVNEFRQNNIDYLILTDSGFKKKLSDIGFKPDLVVNASLNDNQELVIRKFDKVLRSVQYSLLIKLGARVAGPISARKAGIPYWLVDGGLPDYLSDADDLYGKITFQQASKLYITSQFPWEFPNRIDLNNIEVICYPISQNTKDRLSNMTNLKRADLLKSQSANIVGELPYDEDLLIDLVMTGDYLTPPNRVTYNGWLTARQYDQSVGFVRRLITDLGELKKDIYIFLDVELASIVSDLLSEYKNIFPLSFKKWSFNTELIIQYASDVTISRATNYQPYIAFMCKGCNVTSPVPADGYMDEDSAGLQYESMGLTKYIPYDLESYVSELINFLQDEKRIREISISMNKNLKFIEDRNLCDLAVQNVLKQKV